MVYSPTFITTLLVGYKLRIGAFAVVVAYSQMFIMMLLVGYSWRTDAFVVGYPHVQDHTPWITGSKSTVPLESSLNVLSRIE
jgi:hypothetical protein